MNAGANEMQGNIGDDLFQEGMGTSNSEISNPSRCRVVMLTNLALGWCCPVSESMEGRQSLRAKGFHSREEMEEQKSFTEQG